MQENRRERYGRQLLLPGFGLEGQRRLLAASVLVVGAGGLGCPVLQYLCAAGVGRIGIVDGDKVSLSNLHRQVLFAMEDIGKPKAAQARKHLHRLNPEVTINVYPYFLSQQEALGLVGQYDLVIDASDNFPAKYLINDACVLSKKPLVYGAVSQYEGQLSVFNLEQGGLRVDYRHWYPKPPEGDPVLSCEEAGVLGVLPGIIGTMQATEAIKLLAGIGTPACNKMLVYQGLLNQLYDIHYNGPDVLPDAHAGPQSEAEFLAMDYPAFCGQIGQEELGNQIVPLTVEELLALGEETVLVDVREKYEQPLLSSIPHVNMPFSQFQQDARDVHAKRCALLCQSGKRALQAASWLAEAWREKGQEGTIYVLKGNLADYRDKLDEGKFVPYKQLEEWKR